MRVASSLLGLVLAGVACAPDGRWEEMRLVDWPGRDGSPVALDQALVVEFSHRVDPYLRPGAFQLRPGGRRRMGMDLPFEINGRHFILNPRLPRLPDLSDGSLLPGTSYELILRGVPRLAAVTSPEGAALLGDRVIEFATAAAGDPAALAGEAAVGGPLQLALPAGGRHRQAVVDAEGWTRIPVRPGIDPRSLAAPARLLLSGAPVQTVGLELEENGLRGAVLRARVGRPGVWAALDLPAELEGLGGQRLLDADRRIRLIPLP